MFKFTYLTIALNKRIIMIEKFRKNFKLANILVKILFVCSFVLANWFSISSAVFMVMEQGNTWIALATGVVMGTILVLILPFLINWVLNISRFRNIPRAEYVLLALAFFTFANLTFGLLNLFRLLNPLMAVWGSLAFHILTTVGFSILFYVVTSKLYFNDVTKPHYFKVVCIVCLCLLFFGGAM